MSELDFHADDYGISINNSKRIIELVKTGKLDSFSIIGNMGCYEECMSLLSEEWETFANKPSISVHLNLIDGYRLSAQKEEIIEASWGSYFIKSFLSRSKRDENRRVIKEEIKCQIERVYSDVSKLHDEAGEPVGLCIDSHVHTHMIPIVFDAMVDALKELELLSKVSYIRNSREPFWMFFTTRGVAGTFPIVNAVKNVILNLLGSRVKRKLKAFNIESGILFGLMLSGRMDFERVSLLLPKMEKYAELKKEKLEILCHPGIVIDAEKRPEYGVDDLNAFFSGDRDTEYEMLTKVR